MAKRKEFSEEKQKIIKGLLEAEMSEHVEHEPYERSDSSNARNGHKKKQHCLQ